jgi:hypothetical protein
MIGALLIPYGDETVRAELNEDGTWSVQAKGPNLKASLEAILGAQFDPDQYSYPACGEYGYAALADAAKLYSGKVVETKPVKTEPGRIY